MKKICPFPLTLQCAISVIALWTAKYIIGKIPVCTRQRYPLPPKTVSAV